MGRRWRGAALWLVAVVVTLASARWQRLSGPTYPVSGEVMLGGKPIAVELTRSHGGAGDQPVRILAPDVEVGGEIAWRRYPSADPWVDQRMTRDGDWLAGALPHQPPAGKLEYQVRLTRGDESATFPQRPAITRFKAAVPAAVLIPHILAMFIGMLLSTRTGLEALWADGKPAPMARLTLLLIGVGGFFLGPAVQKYAFDAWWTGVPFGWDLTDNKTLLAGLAWAWAVWRLRGGRRARGAVVAAALVTLAVFVIPHSVWGSEIDWEAMDAGN